jgi:outer membrane protein TolC
MRLKILALSTALMAVNALAADAAELTAGAATLTLSVEECRRRALATDEDIKKSDYDIESAAMDLEVAKRSFYPTLDGMGLLEYITPDMEFSGIELQMRGLYAAGLSITQPIYTGGKLTAGKKLAQIGTEAAQQKLRLSRAQIISNADNAYWTLVAVDGKVEMLRSYVRQMDTLYSQTERAVEIGMTTRSDLLRIEARRTEIEYNLKKALNGRDLCRLALCRVIGVDFSTEITPSDTDIAVTEPAMMDNDISARPELELLNLAINANKQQVKMAKADYLPTVGLGLGYYRYGNIKTVGSYQTADGGVMKYSENTNKGLGAAMLSVSIPIFNWGITGKKVNKAKIDLAKSQLDLDKNRRMLTLEAQQAINNVADGYDLVKSAQIALAQAEDNLASVEARYKVAMCPIIDLLDAQSQWQQSKSNLLEARAQYQIYQTEYLRTTGRLD